MSVNEQGNSKQFQPTTNKRTGCSRTISLRGSGVQIKFHDGGTRGHTQIKIPTHPKKVSGGRGVAPTVPGKVFDSLGKIGGKI